MKKGLAVLLVFGLLLMGVTPVLAAGGQVKAAAAAQQGEVVQVVVPKGEKLEVSLLSETKGGQAQVLIRIAQGAIRVGRTVKNFADKHPFISGIAVGHYASKYVFNPIDRTIAKAWNKAKNMARSAAKRAVDFAKRTVSRATVSLARNSLRDPILWPVAR